MEIGEFIDSTRKAWRNRTSALERLQGFTMNAIYLKQVIVGLTALSMTATVLAQYIWLDEKGIKQYSDMAPPISVPKDRILKEPASRAQPQAKAASAASSEGKPAAAEKTPPAAPMSTAEKNADFNKRKMEQADKDKKAADLAKTEADKAKNCERARNYSQGLANGERAYHIGKNGEREYLSDDQRAKEIKDAKSILDNCK